jgi:DNA mismatch repair protein MutS
MSLIDDYIELDKKYKQQYGNETVILMEVGDFFEMYGVQNEHENIGANLQDISDLLNIRVTSKNKSKNLIDRTNPLMSGFPSYIIEKHIQTLVENQYTVVIVEQYENKSTKYYKQYDRKVSKIITPSTYFNYHSDSTNYSNYLMVCYWEIIKQKSIDCLSFGCSLIDITTGNTCFYESVDKDSSSTFSLEEAYRITQMYNPTEVLHISFDDFDEIYQKKIIDYLHTNSNNKVIEKWNINKIYKKIRYQEECIKKSYSKFVSYISPIDTIKLDMKPLSIISFCYMLQYVYEHDEKLVTNLLIPTEIEKNKHMSIEYNSIQQLNIKNNNKGEFSSSRDKCLSKILNRCLTTFGKRKYWNWLINPIIDVEILNSRYNNIDFYIKNNLYVQIRKYLKLICDIQKFLRKISLEKITPNEWNILTTSFHNILTMLNIIKDNNGTIKDNINITEELLTYINIIFNLDECSKYGNLNEIKSNIFNEGINHEIDTINKLINNNFNYFNKIIEFIENISGETEICKLEYNEKQGYYLLITKKRWDNFIQKLKLYYKRKENKNYDISLDLTVFEYKKKDNEDGCKNKDGNVTITKTKRKASVATNKIEHFIEYPDLDDFNFDSITTKPISASSSNIRLMSSKLDELSNIIINEQNKIQKHIANEYIKYTQDFFTKFETKYLDLIQYISDVDIYCTNSLNAMEYSYNKPHPILNDNSFIIAKDIRHPIVERIQTQHKYIENDITLGILPEKYQQNDINDQESINGILLYGVNSSGKSTLMKSIGLNIIMAQAGMYVPCSKFTYSPYKHIFTRINGNDNIYRGMSSFTVEMTELKNILDRCNKNSLILGDELCSGTESISALSIVASGILDILSKHGNFVFATHLHELCDLDVIKNVEVLKKIQVYHIHVDTDTNGNIIFDRKLTKGKGSSVYGLEICKYLKLPEDFLKNAEKIRKQIMDISTNFVEPKVSKYNSKLIVSSCAICGYIPNGGIPLETHHIIYQQFQDENGFVKINNTKIHKNEEYNLIPLCQKCHDNEHNGTLHIKGFIETSNGKKLVYDKKDELKINEHDINDMELKDKDKKCKSKKSPKRKLKDLV